MGRQLVGFDIGESTLKMVHTSGREIKTCVVADVPDNTVKNGAIVSMDAMADFIRESARKNDIPKANASVIIPAITDTYKVCDNAGYERATAYVQSAF